VNRFLNNVVWKIAIGASSLGFVLWWLHATLNRLNPPNDGSLDTALWILASACKVVTLLALPFLLHWAGRHLHCERELLRRAVICWTLGLFLLVGCLALTHETIAETLSNDSVRFFYVDDASPLVQRHYLGREDWLPRWESGQIFLSEIAFGVFVITFISLVCFRWGNRRIAAAVLLAGIAGSLVGYHMILPISVFDYDFFLGGIYSDSLLLDLLFPFVAADPVSEISLTVLFVFVLSTLIALSPRIRAASASFPSTLSVSRSASA
jgi:hypothetical protein